MKLVSVQIYNYRSIQKTKFKLADNVSSLIGVNGSGKSNTLSALLLLKKVFENRPSGRSVSATTNRAKIKCKILHDSELIELSARIDFETDNQNHDDVLASDLKWKFPKYDKGKLFEFPAALIPQGHDDNPLRGIGRLSGPFSGKRNFHSKLMVWFELLRDNDFKKHPLPILVEICEYFRNISYYSATQFTDPSKCPVSVEIEDDRPRRKWDYRHDHFILDLYESYKSKDNKFFRFISTVNSEGLKLIDKLEFNELPIPNSTYKVKSGGNYKQIVRERKLIVPVFTINNFKLSPNQLSEGTFKTLALLFYIITSESKLLLIEEPEVCVHHGLLDSVLKLIISCSKQRQTIITTHSDLVLDKVLPENVFTVNYLPDEGTTVTPLLKSLKKDGVKALRLYLKETGNLGEYWREGGLYE